ncbi:hypothetical protein [uncultured Microbacterium sp.]|uniref:hypothetical protein n=1 Tax=uncultured Microbacterium sp. TaxID=191216 RepID=UPI0025E3F826|nr:hypothetical protein [uncultured Microbacterium sp.]
MPTPSQRLLDLNFGYIYRVTNSATGRTYIGKREQVKGEPWDAYRGSSLWLNREIARYGESAFTKEFVEFAKDRNSLTIAEALYIAAELEYGNTYNLTSPLGVRGLSDRATRELLVNRVLNKTYESDRGHGTGYERVVAYVANLNARLLSSRYDEHQLAWLKEELKIHEDGMAARRREDRLTAA